VRGNKSASVTVLRRKVAYEPLMLAANKVDVNSVLAIQFYHDQNQARRKKELTESSTKMFKLTTSSDLPVPEFDDDEIEAEQIASYKRVVFTDSKLNVIHGHEAVLLARENGNEPILVFKLKEKLSPQEIFILQVRHAAKEGLLFPAIRIEIIRTLFDEMNFNISDVRLMLRNPRNKKPTPKDVSAEFYVGQLFEKYPGYTVPFTGFELDKGAFSNLKYLAGNNTILDEMKTDDEMEQHFLRMGITNAKTRSTRLNTEIPKLMKYPDTKDILFTQGLQQAKALLKAKYPEENYSQHPQMELLSVEAKMANPETGLILKPQMEANPQSNQVLKSIIAINEHVGDWSPAARRHILRSLCLQSPQDYADVLLEVQPEAFGDQLKRRQQQLRKAGQGLQ